MRKILALTAAMILLATAAHTPAAAQSATTPQTVAKPQGDKPAQPGPPMPGDKGKAAPPEGSPAPVMKDAPKPDAQGAADEEALSQIDNATSADDIAPVEDGGLHKALRTKFIEGDAGFMSLVALALVLGLAFCIERIVYLSLSEIDAKRFMADLSRLISEGKNDEALQLCRSTRGPVASICCQGMLRIGGTMADIERSVTAYGSVQAANLERGCSWITLFIAMAPSLGFLGTVIGMVMAFEQIQQAGDISPTIVAAGMKVALITTIFGIIVALILQLFYNYILSKIDHLTSQMEESAISLLDAIQRVKLAKGNE